MAKYNIIDKETNPVIKEPGYELGFDKVNTKRFFLMSRHPFFQSNYRHVKETHDNLYAREFPSVIGSSLCFIASSTGELPKRHSELENDRK